MAGQAEALHIMRRLNREYPDARGTAVTNLALLTAIKTLGLSYNKAVDFRYRSKNFCPPFLFRWWILNEICVKKTDFSTIPHMSKVFREAEENMLPKGMVAEEEAASIPLQNLLDHSIYR